MIEATLSEDKKKMRSELTEEPTHSTNRHRNQFVEDIGQTVANALFGYANTNGKPATPNEEETGSMRPKRSAKKVQQVYFPHKFNFRRLNQIMINLKR